ncbi:MAG: hypothetical protein HZR80_02245 [Candidatus Heimdallarchaeota archaeon]
MIEPLHWVNDPLLFDSALQPVNQWVNANELIQQNRSNEIFLQDGKQLSLYPIMIRKIDFVRKKALDRIMARFPFLVIDEAIQEQIVKKILLISEVTRDYFYKSINKSILQWKQAILNYLSRGTLPFPIVRCCFELVPNLHALVNETSLRFTSARGEAFKMPTILTKELAYLAGMVNGDGNLQKYTLRIVDYSITNIKQLHRMFEDYFAQTGNILYKTENCPEVVITNLWIVRLFSFLTSQPIGGKKYHALREPLIFQQDSTFRSYYWSGVMDADGSYKNKNVTFISASTRYVKDFKKFLLEYGINSKLTEREVSASVYIPSNNHTRLAKVLVCLHPEKKLEFNALESTPSRIPAYFVGFKDSSQLNNYFNFKLMKSLSIAGLGKTIRHFRGKQSRRIFVESLDISERSLQDIENEVMSINVLLLDEILKQNQKQLMPFLTQQTSIRYHIRSSVQIKLDTHPNEQLAFLLKPLLFYKQRINIPITKSNLKQKIENHFQISLENNRITNRILLQYFSVFCDIEHSKNF